MIHSVVNIPQYTPFCKRTFCRHCFGGTRQFFEGDLEFLSHRLGTKKTSSWLISEARTGPLAQLQVLVRFPLWTSWRIWRSGVPNLKAHRLSRSSVNTLPTGHPQWQTITGRSVCLLKESSLWKEVLEGGKRTSFQLKTKARSCLRQHMTTSHWKWAVNFCPCHRCRK